MAVLHNRVSQKELKGKAAAGNRTPHHHFFLPLFSYCRPTRLSAMNCMQTWRALNVFGRIYVAHEGINAQISVPQNHFEAFKTYLYSIEPLNGIRLNIAVDDDGKSFWVLKIKVREKIVADGITDPAFDMANRGKYVNAADFNQLTEDPDTIVVDMRNHYEYEVGHFEGAIEMPSDTFREQLPMAADMLKEPRTKTSLCIALAASVAKKPVLTCCTKVLKMCIIWKAALSIMPTR